MYGCYPDIKGFRFWVLGFTKGFGFRALQDLKV